MLDILLIEIRNHFFSYLTHLVLMQSWVLELSCKVLYIKIGYMPSYKKSLPFSASSLSLPLSPLPLAAISFDLAQMNPFLVLLGSLPPHLSSLSLKLPLASPGPVHREPSTYNTMKKSIKISSAVPTYKTGSLLSPLRLHI